MTSPYLEVNKMCHSVKKKHLHIFRHDRIYLQHTGVITIQFTSFSDNNDIMWFHNNNHRHLHACVIT